MQDKNNRSGWLNAREVFLGLTFKGKITTKEISSTEKLLIIVPKSGEATTVKILK